MSMPENPSTKEKLFIAAIRLFAKEGYKGTTVRNICKEAGTANATAVNYYFGSKKKLYKKVLDMIFAENLRRRQEGKDAQPGPGDGAPDDTPEARLRRFLTVMVDVGFSDEPLLNDVVAIVLREMMSPSPFLDQIVDEFIRPDGQELSDIIQEILGPEAPPDVVRDCLASVGGQINYYLAFWPIISRAYPDHPGIQNYREELLDHVMRFSMAGLKAVRDNLKH